MAVMFDPLDFEKRPLRTRLSRLRAWTRLVLLLENGGEGLWRILSWIAFFSGLWLLHIPQIGGKPGLILSFFIFLSGLALLLYKDAAKLRWPGETAADRRLEEESGLRHRPLAALSDTLANPGKSETRILWSQNREHAAAALRNLRMPLPKPVLPQKDPYALRFLALLFLLTGLAVAGPQSGVRLAQGLLPFSGKTEAPPENSVTVWITPPAYTGIAQITLQGADRNRGTPKIPEGSHIKILVNGGFLRPSLVTDTGRFPLEKRGDGQNWGLETTIAPGARLVLRQGPLTRAIFPYDYIADEPPQIALNGQAEATSKGALRVPLTIGDDYGVAETTLRIALGPETAAPPLGNAFTETRPTASAPGVTLDLAPVYDLAWHPWAGLPVVATIEVKDGKGQKAAAPPLHIVLPEKPFTNPVAQRLIALRKRLIRAPEEESADAVFELHRALSEIAESGGAPAVFLSLRSAAARLAYDSSLETAARVAELLWDAALTLEEGNLPLAARALEEARKNLEQALADPNAADEQIAQALEELQQALAAYFEEMFRDLQRQMAEKGMAVQIPPELMQNTIAASDIESFLDRLRAESLSGDRGAAREKLAQLRQFMDMLESAQDMAMPEPLQFMMEGIGKIQQLIEQQKTLRDETAALAEKRGTAASSKPLETKQEKLRAMLGDLMLDADEKLGGIPENMGKAEIVMRKAAQELFKNAPDAAVPHQEEAIRHLESSSKDMAQQIRQMMRQMTLLSLGAGGRLDPLGRPLPQEGTGAGFFTDSRIKIPDEAQRKSVQDILKTLRQRAGERGRPDYERDYYHRLMKQF